MESRAAKRLAEIFSRSNDSINLAEAAASLALVAYPNLDTSTCLGEIEVFADRVKAELQGWENGHRAVSAINRALFAELGFRGNRENYYDPRNSFLNDVVERRIGLPITLSVIYIEMGRRLDLPIYGIGLPGHFLVQYDDGTRSVFVDPFHEGRILTRDGCRELVEAIHGRPVELGDQAFVPVDSRYILLRMCNNLRDVYLHRRQYSRALEVCDAALAIDPGRLSELKNRGWLRRELGMLKGALADLERYAAQTGESESAEARAWIKTIRRSAASMN